MKLKYGTVVKYNERGFGFVKEIVSSGSVLSNEAFFHISVVKALGIESELNSFNTNSNINFWFVVESTIKGMAVSNAWTDAGLIPNEYLVELAENMAVITPTPTPAKIVKKSTLEQLLENAKNRTEVLPVKSVTLPFLDIFDDPRFSDQRLKLDYRVTGEEIEQIKKYVRIYKSERCSKHHEVNEYITKHRMWDQFSEMRSMNDHGINKIVPGILPKFYRIVCKILSISGENGSPLLRSESY